MPHDEYEQLNSYIMLRNHSMGKLEPIGFTEMGNNFYVWRNITKDYRNVVFSIPLEGNRDFIEAFRRGEIKHDGKRESIYEAYRRYTER